MQTQPFTKPVHTIPAPRPPQPDYINLFLEPAWPEPYDDAEDDDLEPAL